MTEEKIRQELRVKNINEARNYFVEELKRNKAKRIDE